MCTSLLIEVKYCTRFWGQWRNKEMGKWEHTVLSAGVEDASTHIALIQKPYSRYLHQNMLRNNAAFFAKKLQKEKLFGKGLGVHRHWRCVNNTHCSHLTPF